MCLKEHRLTAQLKTTLLTRILVLIFNSVEIRNVLYRKYTLHVKKVNKYGGQHSVQYLS